MTIADKCPRCGSGTQKSNEYGTTYHCHFGVDVRGSYIDHPICQVRRLEKLVAALCIKAGIDPNEVTQA